MSYVRHKYLVTGAAGFIASRVVRLLLQAGHQVVGIDDLNDTYDPRLKDWRLAQLLSDERFQFHRLDIADRGAVDESFAASAPLAAVIHLAARAGIRPSVESPFIYFRTNVDGTLNLLECCRRFAVGKTVLASTSSLYGADTPVPFREDAATDRPLSPYTASKKAAESLAFTYHHLHGLDVTVLRYFTVYGPAGRPDMSMFRFIRNISEGEPIVVFGDGKQQRDFTYVDDIAAGTVAALKPVGFEVVNLGGDRPVVLMDMIEKIAQRVGRRPIIDFRPAHPADAQATWADIGKARSLLDWSPTTTFEQGLEESVRWYELNRDTAVQYRL